MRRRLRPTALHAFWTSVLVGVLVLLVAALTDDRRLAFSPGVLPLQVAVAMQPGERACQTPFVAKRAFNALRFQVGTYRRPGQPLELTLRELPGRGVVATGSLPAGYSDFSSQTVRVRPVAAGKRLELCFVNRGERRVALYGAGPRLGRRGTLVYRGRPLDLELTLDFLREPRSMLSLLPTVFERAALFRPSWVGAWTFWVLLALSLLALPLLLGHALRSAARD